MPVIERQALGQPWLKQLSPVFHLGGTGFDPRSAPLGFAVSKVVLEQDFLEFLGFLLPVSFYQFYIVIFKLLSEGQADEIRDTLNKPGCSSVNRGYSKQNDFHFSSGFRELIIVVTS